jgi:hypothetical protein
MDSTNLISTNYKLLSRARTALTLKLLTSVKLSLLVHKNNRPRLAGTWQQNAPAYFFFSSSFIFSLSFFKVLKSYQLFCPLFKFLSFSATITFFLRSLCFCFIFIYFIITTTSLQNNLYTRLSFIHPTLGIEVLALVPVVVFLM